MLNMILAGLVTTREERRSSENRLTSLFEPLCRVLASTPPTLISAASMSCGVSSPQESDLLAMWISRLAEEYGLATTVTASDKRLRASFARLAGVEGQPNAGS
jgi:hypothetical protein